jgi:anaerobic ribonucleoside-triphosphate reductase activating protein
MKIHAMERCSRANGPGSRFVVWFQGCTLGCPGCFNPKTHRTDGREISVDELASQIPGDIEGITLSGGEPLQQAEAAAELLDVARARGLSTLAFSGTNQRIHLLTDRYRLDEIEATPVAEIRIDRAGGLVFSGVDPLRMRR